MASLFNAFLSDDESDAGVNTKPKKSVSSKAKPTAPKTKKPVTRSSKPQPVAKKHDGKKPFKKEKILEPSHVSNNKPRGSGGRGRGRPRPGDTDSRDKRYFDKKSGTGRGKGAKKGGAGGHNWGSQLESQYNTNFSISGGATEEAKPEGEKPEEKKEEDEVPPEPEKETFTLKEFMKKKAEKRAEAGAGFEELSAAAIEEIKDGKAYTKKDKTALETEDVLMSFGSKKSKQKKKETQNRAGTRKHVEGLGFRVKNPDRERNERRGGYRGRGRGGNRGNRGGYKSRPKIDVDTTDQQNFPQLGA